MKLDPKTLEQIENDLGLNQRFVKGKDIPIRNTWHYCTDGNAVDALFYDTDDFKDGMNRAFFLSVKYRVTIIAFVLMGNHVHFILHGARENCERFIREYVRLTSQSIFYRHGERNKLVGLSISGQAVDNDSYLKTVICYVLKNPVVAGLHVSSYDYPWSSGSLLFREKDLWTRPSWALASTKVSDYSSLREFHSQFRSHFEADSEVTVIDDMVFPGEYVPVEVVERIFKTPKAFHHFMGLSKELEVESRAGTFSGISLPDAEMRQHRDEICQELFGRNGIRSLGTTDRIRLARTIRHRFNSSLKQIARLTGISYDVVKNLV